MGLVIDTPWCYGPWIPVDSAGQPIELSRVGEEIEDRRERAEAREMAERLRRQVGKWDGRTDLAEPQQRTVVELAGAGADGAGVAASWEAKAQQAEQAVARRMAKQLAEQGGGRG